MAHNPSSQGSRHHGEPGGSLEREEDSVEASTREEDSVAASNAVEVAASSAEEEALLEEDLPVEAETALFGGDVGIEFGSYEEGLFLG